MVEFRDSWAWIWLVLLGLMPGACFTLLLAAWALQELRGRGGPDPQGPEAGQPQEPGEPATDPDRPGTQVSKARPD